jgi:hypothetical protein
VINKTEGELFTLQYGGRISSRIIQDKNVLNKLDSGQHESIVQERKHHSAKLTDTAAGPNCMFAVAAHQLVIYHDIVN